jgi:hypothetical protein
MKLVTDLFTERDGVSWCYVRIASLPILGTMLYKFIVAGTADYQGFALGVAAIFASIAFKNQSEKDHVQ